MNYKIIYCKFNFMKPHRQIRWRKQLEVAMQISEQENQKYYRILNFDEALNSYVAMIQLKGPPGSPYEGYSFLIEYAAPLQFPFRAPKVKFITIPWNPFVCPTTGKICCDILDQNWFPSLVVRTVLISLISLLEENKLPNNEPGLNIDAAAEMRHAKQDAEAKDYRNLNLYKDEEKPPADHPEDLIKQDEKFMSKKQAFMKDQNIKQKYEKKIKKFGKKIHKKKQ